MTDCAPVYIKTPKGTSYIFVYGEGLDARTGDPEAKVRAHWIGIRIKELGLNSKSNITVANENGQAAVVAYDKRGKHVILVIDQTFLRGTHFQSHIDLAIAYANRIRKIVGAPALTEAETKAIRNSFKTSIFYKIGVRAGIISPPPQTHPSKPAQPAVITSRPMPTAPSAANISAIAAFKKKTGQNADIILRFLAFSTGLNFPTEEVKAIRAEGGVPFIKLEPWNPEYDGDKNYSLDAIIAGRCDDMLKKFAQGCKKYGGPIFISFGHEMNGNWYPWSGNPAKYKAAYQRVHKIMTEAGAANITWVFNPDVCGPFTRYYPGDWIGWVMLDGYNTVDYTGKSRTPKLIFKKAVDEAALFKRPIGIGETGCDDNGIDKEAWLRDLVEYVVGDSRIKAFIYLDTNKMENGQPKNWGLAENNSLKGALQKYPKKFSGRVRTDASSTSRIIADPNGGIYFGGFVEEDESELTYLNRINTTVGKKNGYFYTTLGIQHGDPHSNNRQRLSIAADYLKVANIDRSYFQKAVDILNVALKSPDPTQPYYTPYYFDILLALADTYLSKGDYKNCTEYCNRVLAEIGDLNIRNNQHVRPESIEGIKMRAKLIKAYMYLASGRALNNSAMVESIFREVIAWADKSGNRNPILLWWDMQSKDGVFYLREMARLGLADLMSSYSNLTSEQIKNEIIPLYAKTLEWDKVGKKDGYVDLGVRAILGAVRVSLRNGNIAWADKVLLEKLPWGKINAYPGLLKLFNGHTQDIYRSDKSYVWPEACARLYLNRYLSAQAELLLAQRSLLKKDPLSAIARCRKVLESEVYTRRSPEVEAEALVLFADALTLDESIEERLPIKKIAWMKDLAKKYPDLTLREAIYKDVLENPKYRNISKYLRGRASSNTY